MSSPESSGSGSSWPVWTRGQAQYRCSVPVTWPQAPSSSCSPVRVPLQDPDLGPAVSSFPLRRVNRGHNLLRFGLSSATPSLCTAAAHPLQVFHKEVYLVSAEPKSGDAPFMATGIAL